MNDHWRYTIEGTAGDGQTWKTEGECLGDIADNGAFTAAMRSSFHQLTGGKAVFGKPGVGCRGPYNITSFRLERLVH